MHAGANAGLHTCTHYIQVLHTYIHTFIHFIHTFISYIHTLHTYITHIHAYRQTDRQTDRQKDIQTDTHSYIDAKIPGYMHTYIVATGHGIASPHCESQEKH